MLPQPRFAQRSSGMGSSSGRSGFCMLLLKSYDGYNWERCGSEPILVPSEKGWASSYIMGCDVHYKADEKCWYCYFSASGKKKFMLKMESIGLLIGSVPEKKTRL